ncbi:MAG TPA: ABC transporter permease [Galbitalea sp.]|nr:ABC transporter permease [Galbitalea sp.]
MPAPVQWLRLGREYGILGFFVLLLLVFGLGSSVFFSVANLVGILTAASVTALFALAEALVVLVGALDLSIVAVAALSGVVAALTIQSGAPGWVGILVGLLIGAACGTLNAVLVEFLRISPLIATLATLTTLTGVALIVSGGNPIFGITQLSWLGQGRPGGIPTPVYIMIAMYLILGLIMSQTVFGGRLLAVGGNPEAAQRAGVRKRAYVFAPFVLSGTIAGLAGIVVLGRLGTAEPTFADNTLFDAITAVALAGVLLTGGRGSVLKVLVGALIVATIDNGLLLLGVSTFWSYVTTGGLLALAVWGDGAISRAIERVSLAGPIVTEEQDD